MLRDRTYCSTRALRRSCAWWRVFEKGTSKTLESSHLSLSHACQRPRLFSSRLDRGPYRIRRRDI